jgi:CubicO group peptidase (beta-lactamase class C family)
VFAEYSNVAMAVAGVLVGRASGLPYRDYVGSNLLAPLGMRNSCREDSAVPQGLLATGYRLEGDSAVAGRHWRLGAAEAMGGLYSSVADMCRYLAFQLSAWPPRSVPDEGPVQRASLRESHQVAGFGKPGTTTFGINWVVVHHPVHGYTVTHTGGTFLYGAAVRMLPERGLGVVVLTNTGGAAGEVGFKMADVAERMQDILFRHDPQPGIQLTEPVAKAIAWTCQQLANPDRAEIGKKFSKSFLGTFSAEKMVALFTEAEKTLGLCSGHEPLRLLGKHAAVVRLSCKTGSASLTLYLNEETPRKISGFAIRPD